MNQTYTRRLVLLLAPTSLAAQVFLFIDTLPLALRMTLLLFALVIAPGALLVEWLLGAHYGDDDASRLEKLLYGLGAGYMLLVTAALVVSFLPGGVAAWQILLLPNVVLIVAAAALWRRSSEWPTSVPTFAETQDFREGEAGKGFSWNSRRGFWVGVALVLVIGGLLRLPALGYSEFQGDEARVMLRASEVIEGYENALFAHQKMPGEILIATAVYATLRQMDETAARLPFTIAGLAALLGVMLLGTRLFGAVAGVSAGLLAALTGYFVAFARIVQYQSLILLSLVLALLVLWQMLAARRQLWRYLTMAALFLALGALAHYEALSILPPVLFIVWRLWRSGVRVTALLRALPLPLLAFTAPVLLFVAPFVQDPTFTAAYTYAVDYRIGAGGFPYNNLIDFFQRASLYGTAYYVLLMTLCVLIALVSAYRRALPEVATWLLTLLAVGGLLLIMMQASWLIINGVDQTWLFFALLLGFPLVTPSMTPAERLVWWWFGPLVVLDLFVVQHPNSHVYILFVPWILLASMVLARATAWLATTFSTPTAQAINLTASVMLILIFGFYLQRLFIHTEVEVLRLWLEQRPHGYWMPFDMPPEIAIFGFPHNNGWKAIGVQYADGALDGNFLTNEKPEVVDWYTRGAGACPRGNRYYIVVSRTEPQADAAAHQLRNNVANEFSLRQVVEVLGQPKLYLFDQPGTYDVERLDLTAFAFRFDRVLTDPTFAARRGRVINPTIQHQLGYRLGDEIELLGYDLDTTTVSPGDTLNLTLYWRALRPMQNAYTVFNQVIDLATTAKAGQVDGMPVCDRNPTGQWFSGDIIADPYTISISTDATPGSYTLISGMYNPATGARLEMMAPDGAKIGGEAALTEIVVQ